MKKHTGEQIISKLIEKSVEPRTIVTHRALDDGMHYSVIVRTLFSFSIREAEVALAGGETIAQACRRIGVREQTFYRWRQE